MITNLKLLLVHDIIINCPLPLLVGQQVGACYYNIKRFLHDFFIITAPLGRSTIICVLFLLYTMIMHNFFNHES